VSLPCCFPSPILDRGSVAPMGTAFTATEENELAPSDKERVVRGRGQDTVWTQVLDILGTRMRNSPAWPEGIGCRVEANVFIRKWHGRGSRGQSGFRPVGRRAGRVDGGGVRRRRGSTVP
jgi:hypothetical protein